VRIGMSDQRLLRTGPGPFRVKGDSVGLSRRVTLNREIYSDKAWAGVRD